MRTVSAALAEQWKALYEELSSGTQRTPALAGLFLGCKPEGFDLQDTRILFVGKATAGSFKENDSHEQSFNGNSSFWQFARALSQLSGNSSEDLRNVAWSNVSKIGVVNGNPPPSLELAQAALAAKTLRQEIRDCHPSIVVFVCDGYGDDTVYEAVSAQRGGTHDFKTIPSDHGEFYSRKVVNLEAEQLPPMLWLKHPQGKTIMQRSEWIEEFKRLLD